LKMLPRMENPVFLSVSASGPISIPLGPHRLNRMFDDKNRRKYRL
jgi:hypothetical protein